MGFYGKLGMCYAGLACSFGINDIEVTFFCCFFFCEEIQDTRQNFANIKEKYTNTALWHPLLLQAKVVAPPIMLPYNLVQSLSESVSIEI